MFFADGTVKRGLFENNVFIEEVIDEDEKENESSMLVEAKPDKHEQNLNSEKPKKRKKLRKPPT